MQCNNCTQLINKENIYVFKKFKVIIMWQKYIYLYLYTYI